MSEAKTPAEEAFEKIVGRGTALYRGAWMAGWEARDFEVAHLMNLLNDIRYCFKNIWALDRKKFEAHFMPRIDEALGPQPPNASPSDTYESGGGRRC